ncbi:MAG: hypothetical protein U0794_01115 [Isosphaeraceae bacterium]
MIRFSSRWLAPIGLALVLLLASSHSAMAQEPAPEGGGQSEGRPFDGYFAAGVLAGAALFAVGKSARR